MGFAELGFLILGFAYWGLLILGFAYWDLLIWVCLFRDFLIKGFANVSPTFIGKSAGQPRPTLEFASISLSHDMNFHKQEYPVQYWVLVK